MPNRLRGLSYHYLLKVNKICKYLVQLHLSHHPLEEVDPDADPVLVDAGALRNRRPAQDLIVSLQHRMFVLGGGQFDGWFGTEAFAPTKSLTAVPGVRHIKGKTQITWIHFAWDR